MNKAILSVLMILMCSFLKAQSSIYDFQLTAVDGTTINFNDFRGKKILIVNTASHNTNEADQLVELEQLYQQFKDSGLVVIAIPSNDFDNEKKSNAQIKVNYHSNYNISFPILAKASNKGNAPSPLLKWLTKKNQNGRMDNHLKKDFQKFLINSNGTLIGVYTNWRPLSRVIVGAIRAN
ncbi:MAG TPA: redoxin domain-containing protein [Chitinophagaceae bacterium]|jgi:glutathione peroxidase|nr:redoxin domain-containing protein [Chitinophagaceae bacterium]